MNHIQELAEDLKKMKAIVLTGAGVSTNSGISDFRSKDGFYQKYHEEDLDIKAFFNNPDKFYIAFQEKFSSVFKAKPNKTHEILAELEKENYIEGIITQNVDRLHQKGGSKNVIEFHGNIFEYDLIQILNADFQHFNLIQKDVPIKDILKHDQIEYRVGLNLLYKPQVVLYGEGISEWETSLALAINHNLHIIMGTSYLVAPFNMLSYENKNPNLKVYVINNEAITYYGNNHATVTQIIGDTSEILKELMICMNEST